MARGESGTEMRRQLRPPMMVVVREKKFDRLRLKILVIFVEP